MTDTSTHSNFLQRVQEGSLLADGAMGTEIYARGIYTKRCYDELNVRQPDIILAIHSDYIAAGAELIETNTFGANSVRLSQYGLADNVEAFNRSGVALAREAAGDQPVFIAGSMGPSGLILEEDVDISSQRAAEAFRQQAAVLADAGVDAIILETFYSLDELVLALAAVKEVCSVPVIAQFSFDPDRQIVFETVRSTVKEVAQKLSDHGADVIGTNCGIGPAVILPIVEALVKATDKPISVMPDAGYPQRQSGRMMYMGSSSEYFAEYARRYAQLGTRIIGGCCGTSPDMIAEAAKFLKGISAEQRSQVFIRDKREELYKPAVPLVERSPFGSYLTGAKGDKVLVSVELSPPKGVSTSKLIEGTRLLKEGGVDVVNIPDGPRAVARMSPIACAKIVQDEVGLDTIVHYCCRDRNLLGMQMDLLGANAMGLGNVMLITGDPPKIGSVQTATPVFDVDAIGLIRMANDMNHGLGLAEAELKGQTRFVIGAGCNPGAIDPETELRRYGEKISAGAEYFFSQPVYLPELLENFLNSTTGFSAVPFFAGILPLASLRNAEFLHNEVPGMQIPDSIMARMRSASSKEEQQREGIRIAQEMVTEAIRHPQVKGIYLFPPFGRYASVLEVLEVI